MSTPPLESRVQILFARLEGSRSLYAGERDGAHALKDLSAAFRRPTDLRWSRDGRRLVIAVGEVVVLGENGDRSAPFSIAASNAAGAIRMTAPATFHGVPSRAGSDDVVSADFTRDDTIVHAHVSGAVRIGSRVLARVTGAKIVRASPSGARIAVVAESDAGSVLHLFDIEGHALTQLEGGLPLGGVAWSPDGEHFAMRTKTAVEVRDASGALARTIDLSKLLEDGEPTSGRIAWTQHGIAALHGPHLVRIAQDDTVQVLAAEGPHGLSFSVSPDGRYAAITTAEPEGGLVILDVQTSEAIPLPWASHYLPDSPVAFSPSGNTLAWATYGGQLLLQPFGAVPIDPETGRAADPDQEHVNRFWRFVRGGPNERAGVETASDAEIRVVIEEIKRTTMRETLQTEATSLRAALEATLRDRSKRASTKSLFKPPPTAPFAVGEKARHAKFGEGKVTAVVGSGETAAITVSFPGGAKTLRSSFLERV